MTNQCAMGKLFDDTPFIQKEEPFIRNKRFFFQKERPMEITDQQEEKLFLDLAKDCIKHQFSSDEEETIADDLKKLSFGDSDYEKAKDLERNGSAYYEIDGEFIDWLGCVKVFQLMI